MKKKKDKKWFWIIGLIILAVILFKQDFQIKDFKLFSILPSSCSSSEPGTLEGFQDAYDGGGGLVPNEKLHSIILAPSGNIIEMGIGLDWKDNPWTIGTCNALLKKMKDCTLIWSSKEEAEEICLSDPDYPDCSCSVSDILDFKITSSKNHFGFNIYDMVRRDRIESAGMKLWCSSDGKFAVNVKYDVELSPDDLDEIYFNKFITCVEEEEPEVEEVEEEEVEEVEEEEVEEEPKAKIPWIWIFGGISLVLFILVMGKDKNLVIPGR